MNLWILGPSRKWIFLYALQGGFSRFGDSEGSAKSLDDFDPNASAFESGVHIPGSNSVSVKDSFQFCGDENKIKVHESALWEGYTLHAWGAEVLQQPALKILQVLVMLRKGKVWKMRWNELSFDRSDGQNAEYDALLAKLKCKFSGGEETPVRTVLMQASIVLPWY
jgi:hypothetical protein